MLGMANHPAPPLAVSESEAETLRAMARAGTTEQRTALRAKIILQAAEGVANVAIADELGISVPTVRLWRTRFKERGLAGLADGPKTGRPAIHGREIRERVLATTLTPPEGATHWSTRRLAKAVGVSPNTILRIWREGRLKPHRTETFKFSRDPELVAKVTDVVGLYLVPPERGIVLSVDEKTQIQALDRTQPMLPMKPGQVERHTHDYKRNGTLVLSAALEVATGQVTNQARERHTGDDFLAFLRLLARTYPTGEVHVMLDNVRVLPAAIERFTREWNAGAGPFTWVKTADEILAKAVRKTQADSGARH